MIDHAMWFSFGLLAAALILLAMVLILIRMPKISDDKFREILDARRVKGRGRALPFTRPVAPPTDTH